MIRRCIRKINFEITNKYRNSFQYFFLFPLVTSNYRAVIKILCAKSGSEKDIIVDSLRKKKVLGFLHRCTQILLYNSTEEL